MKPQCVIAQLLGGKKGAIGARLSEESQDIRPWHLIPSQILGTDFPVRDQGLAFGQYCKCQ